MKHVLIVGQSENISPSSNRVFLESGIQVSRAMDGADALRLLYERSFDAMLLHLGSPEDGLKTLRMIRRDLRIDPMPIIILGPSTDGHLIQRALSEGADGFVGGVCPPEEMSQRIRGRIRRNRMLADLNPLTKLPGNVAILREIQKRLRGGHPFVVAASDLKHFKAVNDSFGIPCGDAVICQTASVLSNCLQDYDGPSGFVGHIGGDDFVFLADPGRAEKIAEAIISSFTQTIGNVLLGVPRRILRGRAGELISSPFVTIHLGLVTNRNKEPDPQDLLTHACEWRSKAKKSKSSHWVADWTSSLVP
ncbi:MAG: GGDEF domain-containing response regulator [Nitrospirae bacterium]|nr:GGDEF domain-containing response regulator [Nitrospirota bacterium]